MKSRAMAIILAAAVMLLAITVTAECFAKDTSVCSESYLPHSHGILWWSTLYEELDGGSVKTEEIGEKNTKTVIKFRAAEIIGSLF